MLDWLPEIIQELINPHSHPFSHDFDTLDFSFHHHFVLLHMNRSHKNLQVYDTLIFILIMNSVSEVNS